MRDTSVEAERRYYELLAKRSPADRLAIAGRLTRSVRALAEMAIKAAEPMASKDEVRARLAERLYGSEVATRLFAPARADAR